MLKRLFFYVIMRFWDGDMENWENDFGVGDQVEKLGIYLENTYVVVKTRRGGSPPLFPVPT